MVIPRPEYDQHLQALEDNHASPNVLHGAYQQRGRDLRPLRIHAGLMFLLIHAEKNIESSYSDFGRALQIRSPWERNIILGHILELCADNKWPLYPVLVGSKAGAGPGKGFYDYLRKQGTSIPSEQVFRVERCQECYATAIPDQDDVAIAILKYIKKL